MNFREILLFFFPFTTSEAYMTLAPFIAATTLLGGIGAVCTYLSGRYISERIGKAYGRSRRSRNRRRKDSGRTPVKKPTRYRSDDPRRISSQDIRVFFLFLLALSILSGSIVGLTAAAGDISRRDPITDLFQIVSVQSRPGGQGMIQAVHMFNQQRITLFYQQTDEEEDLRVRDRYRLVYLPRTRVLVRAERLEPEG